MSGCIKAVLFDVGGPINLEHRLEAGAEAAMVETFAEHGVAVTPDALAQANAIAVASFAPNAYRAMVWHLSDRNVALAKSIWQAMGRRQKEAAQSTFELRPGIVDTMADLRSRGLKLALAANQPASLAAELVTHGLMPLLDYAGLSETLGVRKPDPRLFLAVCSALCVQPSECLMIGDRIDNDIAPAKALGMTALRFRTGRHILQQPRSWDEIPDAEAASVEELREAIDRMLLN